jgi:hypothetical protein
MKERGPRLSGDVRLIVSVCIFCEIGELHPSRFRDSHIEASLYRTFSKAYDFTCPKDLVADQASCI